MPSAAFCRALDNEQEYDSIDAIAMAGDHTEALPGLASTTEVCPAAMLPVECRTAGSQLSGRIVCISSPPLRLENFCNLQMTALVLRSI